VDSSANVFYYPIVVYQRSAFPAWMIVYSSFVSAITRPTRRCALSGALLTVQSLNGPKGAMARSIADGYTRLLEWYGSAGDDCLWCKLLSYRTNSQYSPRSCPADTDLVGDDLCVWDAAKSFEFNRQTINRHVEVGVYN